MKVIIDSRVPYVAERLEGHVDIEVCPGPSITPATLRDADALVVSTRLRSGAPLLEGSRVRLVATGSIGMDHIDTEWCRTHSIEAVNAPGCNAPAVVQYVISSLSAAGFDFSRHTLGVVGKGNIGGLLTQIVRRAGGRVVVCDPPRAEAGLADERYLGLDELLAQSDAVTFHVPLTRKGAYPTYHLLSPEHVGRLRDGAIVVNASRGGVVNEEALRGRAGALTLVIDTWEGEPDLDRRLLGEAFIATPHIAGYSEEGKQRAARSVIEAVNRTLGVNAPVEGLADYSFRENPPALEVLLRAYDPRRDSRDLKSNPADFETQRNSYHFRPEL